MAATYLRFSTLPQDSASAGECVDMVATVDAFMERYTEMKSDAKYSVLMESGYKIKLNYCTPRMVHYDCIAWTKVILDRVEVVA